MLSNLSGASDLSPMAHLDECTQRNFEDRRGFLRRQDFVVEREGHADFSGLRWP